MRTLTLLLLLLSLPALAEHLPGGNIAVRCIGGNQHEVTLKVWRECTGVPMIEQGLTFVNSCGVSFSLNNVPLISATNVSPVCDGQLGQTTCDGGTLIGIEEYTYQVTVFLSSCDYWRIYWSTCCRYSTLNLQGSQGLYIEALLNNAGGPCNALLTFSDNVPPLVCVGQPVSYDPGVLFTQGQELRFRLIEARRLLNADPLNLDIQPVTYQPPFTGAEPYTDLVIDSITGQITFTPLAQGYVVCVIEVRVLDEFGVWRGTIMRDFPFIAQVCDNAVPDASAGAVTNVVGSGGSTGPYEPLACGAVCFDAVITDPDAAQTLTLSSNVTSAIPGATFQVAGTNPATATICMDASALSPGTYLFTITALDDACPVIGSQTYTYSVTVGSNDVSAGNDGSASICPGSFIDLGNLLTGDPGGVWSDGPVVSAAGTYTYTVTGTCGDDVATFTVTETAAPNAGSDAQVDICQGTTVDLTNQLTGDAGGTWSGNGPVVWLDGTYTYTISNACGTDQADFTVTVFAPSSPGLDNQILICPQASAFAMADSLLGFVEPGGSWQLDGLGVDGVFDPATEPEGEYCYTVSNPICGDATACLRINFMDPEDPICITLGIDEGASFIRAHPNPSNGQLQVTLASRIALTLIDASGRTVWSTALNAGTTSIELPAALANGSYAMRAQGTDGIVTVQRIELLR